MCCVLRVFESRLTPTLAPGMVDLKQRNLLSSFEITCSNSTKNGTKPQPAEEQESDMLTRFYAAYNETPSQIAEN